MKSPHIQIAGRRRRTAGFSLVEVLVALIIISVGMLGLAKIQALAYASTGTASLRSLAALQASSLASVMHTNRNYWSVASAGFTYQFVGTAAPTSTDAALTGAVRTCAAVCTAPQLAAHDLNQWRLAINAELPNATGLVSCPTINPVSCTIQLSWSESNAAINQQSQGNTMPGSAARPYTLYVVP
jgi:type IV pilus assembly protein PilV